MLLFAHPGITLGAATIIAGAVNNRHEKVPLFVSLSKYMDIRFLLVGSLLPDIIDKPVGQYFFRETFHNGRIFSHSLLFIIVLAAIGLYFYKARRQIWALSLAAGTLAHLVLDGMWAVPGTLFWPLMGFQFNTIELSGWMRGILDAIIHDPVTLTTELIGLVILVWFGAWAIKKKQVISLVKTGRVK